MVNPTAWLRLTLFAWWLAAATGCGGLSSGSGGIDGGSGTGGTAGVFGHDSGCIECSPGCFSCDGTCFGCMGGTAGSAGSFDVDAGEVMRPWISPFPNTSDNGGWRDTGDDLLCMGATQLRSMSVWSDERGVYAMGDGIFDERVFLDRKASVAPTRRAKDAFIDAGAGAAPPLMDAGPAGAGGFGGVGFGGAGGVGGVGTGGVGGTSECLPGSFQCSGYAIYFNDGESGWQRHHAVPSGQDGEAPLRRLSGVPLAELVVHNAAMFSTNCTLVMLDGSVERCDQSGQPIAGFFAVDAQLAYAAVQDNLLVYDGSTWTAHPVHMPFVPNALWANATDVVIVGPTGRIARLRGGVWTSDNQTIQTLTAVWVGDDDTLWVGTDAGQVLRRDADGTWLSTLSVGGVSCDQTDPILGIWGSGSTVYIHTQRALARWNGTALRDLANWTCALSSPFQPNPRVIRGIWGNAPDELFVAVTDSTRFFDPFIDSCGDGFVMYFDGTTFHRL